MTPKCMVTISRHWHNPEIQSTVSLKGITLSMSLEDYLEGLTRELLAAGRWVTEAQLRSRVAQATLELARKFKEESAKVV
jgi:hypothetical protein